jgi:hypothetical protein
MSHALFHTPFQAPFPFSLRSVGRSASVLERAASHTFAPRSQKRSPDLSLDRSLGLSLGLSLDRSLDCSHRALRHAQQHRQRQQESANWEEDRRTELVGKRPGRGDRERIDPK